MTQKIDRIAQLLNKADIRQAITETRKEFLLNKQEEVVDEADPDDDAFDDEDADGEYDEFDWTTE